eukprot:1322201-Lingulodinium_polyedra.AAC.1
MLRICCRAGVAVARWPRGAVSVRYTTGAVAPRRMVGALRPAGGGLFTLATPCVCGRSGLCHPADFEASQRERDPYAAG